MVRLTGALQSPWKGASIRHSESEDSDSTATLKPPTTPHQKLYECCWDIAVHGTLLSLMNVVAFAAINRFKGQTVLPLKQGVIKAGVMTFSYLGCIESINYKEGKNVRRVYYFSAGRIQALAMATLLNPTLTYAYAKLFQERTVAFLPTMGVSLWNAVGLFSVPFL